MVDISSIIEGSVKFRDGKKVGVSISLIYLTFFFQFLSCYFD